MKAKDLVIHRIDKDNTKVSGKCVFTGEDYSVVVPTLGLERYLSGERIQFALPNVSPDDREFLISGISPAGWKKAFG